MYVIRERDVKESQMLPASGVFFFLVPGAAPSFLSYKKEKKDGGAHYAGYHHRAVKPID